LRASALLGAVRAGGGYPSCKGLLGGGGRYDVGLGGGGPYDLLGGGGRYDVGLGGGGRYGLLGDDGDTAKTLSTPPNIRQIAKHASRRATALQILVPRFIPSFDVSMCFTLLFSSFSFRSTTKIDIPHCSAV